MGKPRIKDQRMKTSLLITPELMHRLKIAALEEHIPEGVSGLLCRIAEEWLSKRKKG